MINKDHLKSVLSEKKKFLEMSEVRFVNPPAYDEISVTRIYDKALELPGMKDYFPSSYSKGSCCNKIYFYNVFNTLHHDKVQGLIEYANK